MAILAFYFYTGLSNFELCTPYLTIKYAVIKETFSTAFVRSMLELPVCI